ncbi:nucleoside deaminase [Falsiroseomonas oryziterrae]|uniref:nucleoside deaminase n=1 Tax=Falsiroseomonas oryziterrae TaxID=2911368 RepID=UPI001F410E88|nr:nucleoside deaminase [Roseomonas sp. NPKOSM-4]
MNPMDIALEEARAAAARGEVPVGAVVTGVDGAVLARAGNEVEARRDPSAHAEMLALRAAASASGDKVLPGATLWVTLEPCAMCAAAISFFRLRRVVFGAYDPKGGAVEHGPRFFAQPTCHHAPEVVGGMREREAGELLRSFFGALRQGD